MTNPLAGPTYDKTLATSQVPPLMVSGVLAVCLVLSGTRWASYLGIGRLYATDVLLACAILNVLLQELRNGQRFRRGRIYAGASAPLFIAIAAVIVWAFVRLLSSPDWNFDAFRDAAPYIYPVAGIIAYISLRRAAPSTVRNTHAFIVGVLAVHATLYGLELIFPNLPLALPLLSSVQELHLLTPTYDIDSTLVGLLSAMILRTVLLLPKYRLLLLLAYALCWIEIGTAPNRGGLLGGVLANALVLASVVSISRTNLRRQLAIFITVPVVLAVGGAFLLTTTVGVKFIASVNPTLLSDSDTAAAHWGEDTTAARAAAWSQLTQWIASDPTRLAVGVGFGPNFLVDSGASLLLVHNETGAENQPRSPHDYWLGSWARLGAAGLILLLAAVLYAVTRIVNGSGRIEEAPLFSLASAGVLVFIVPASVGVILESPFGAVPFWWFLGIVAHGVEQEGTLLSTRHTLCRQIDGRRIPVR